MILRIALSKHNFYIWIYFKIIFMRTVANKCLVVSIAAVLSLIFLSGCTKEYKDYITEEYYGTQSLNVFFTVGKQIGGDVKYKWEWDPVAARYEATASLKDLTKDIYDNGSMVGGVFINPGFDDEWLEILPYQAVYTYIEEETEDVIPYLVNISCAFTPGEVKFFIAPSDRYRDDDALLDTYQFKVTLLWDEYNF
jgi:hypothetical protein